METCIARGISNPPLIQQRDHIPTRARSIHRKTTPPFINIKVASNHGLNFCHNPPLRLAGCRASRNPFDKDEPEHDGIVIVEDTRPGGYDDAKLNEVQQEGSLADNPLQLSKFLEEFDIKFDYEETYPLLVFGGAAAVALWFAAAVVGAIDSIPLLPKMLELVGLGYTVWFSSRYLIFKENRDELFARVEMVKNEVLGSKND